MFKKILILLFVIFIVTNIFSQKKIDIKAIYYKCDSINNLIDSIRKTNIDSLRVNLGNSVERKLQSMLLKSEMFIMPFDSLNKVGKIYSPDKYFRLFNWNVPLSDGTHKFYTIIQLNPGKDSTCKLISLCDQSQNFNGDINKAIFKVNNWFGALYYEIIPGKIEGKTIYTLIGMHFNGLFTNKKIIEPMYFDESGQPVFGLPVFLHNKQIQNRLVFEYSINATMSLRYDHRLKMIIFDHLAPPSALYYGDYKFYGPDFSFDGLKFENGKWNYQENVNVHK